MREHKITGISLTVSPRHNVKTLAKHGIRGTVDAHLMGVEILKAANHWLDNVRHQLLV